MRVAPPTPSAFTGFPRNESRHTTVKQGAQLRNSVLLRRQAGRAIAALTLLTCSIPSFAATTLTINTSVTAGAGDAYADDEILHITASGTVDFSPEGERFGSVYGTGTIDLGSRTISLVGDDGFDGDRFGTGFFGTLTGTSSSKFEKRSAGTFTIGTTNLSGFLGNFEIEAGTLELETDSGLSHTILNRFEGPGEFRKTGNGTLILGNASTSAAYLLSPHSGAITIESGELVFDTSNGNFSLNHSTLSGDGTMGIQGGGPTKYLTLSGDWDAGADFTGNIHIASTGHLKAGADDSLGDQNAVQIDAGGTLTLVGAEGFGSVSGGGTFDVGSNNTGVGADHANALFTGLLQGSGDLTKNGTGTWTLGNSSRNLVPLFGGFSGNLIATDGMLVIDPSNANFTLNHSLLGGSGTLGITGNNSRTVTLAGDWDSAGTNFTGDVHVFSSGRLIAGANDSLGNSTAVQIDSGGVLTLAEGEAFGSVSGQGTFALGDNNSTGVGADNANTTFSGIITGTSELTKNGSGTWTLGGDGISGDTNLPSDVLGGHSGTFTIGSGTVALHAFIDETTTLTNAFLGGGDLQKTGTGRLTLSDLSGFTGDYVLSAGTLGIDTGSGSLSIASDRFSGTGILRKSGAGTLTMNGGDGGFTGKIEVTGGTFESGDGGNSLSDSTAVDLASGTTFRLTDTEGFGSLSGTGTLDLNGYDAFVGADDDSKTFSGQITGLAGSDLIKNGDGNWTLTGTNNDYLGTTTIDAGTLTLGADEVIPNASGLTVNANGTFDVNGESETLATLAGAGAVTLGGGALTTDSSNSTTFSGVISGAGSFIKAGSGTLTLTGTNTHSDPTTISGGTLKIGSGGSLQSAIINDAELRFDRSGTLTQSAIISGTGNLTQSGSGTVILSGANTYTGDTIVTAGTLQLNDNERIADASDLVVNGGTFDLNDFTETLATVSGTGGSIDLGSGTLISTNAEDSPTTYAGVIKGTGTFQKEGAGTLTLTGDNTLSGTFDIDGGTLAANGSNPLGDVKVDLASGTFLDLSGGDNNEGFDQLIGSGTVKLGSRTLFLGGNDHSFQFDGAIGEAGDTGGFTKQGSGTLTLTGSTAYAGTTEITEGTLALDGADERLSNLSVVSISSGATLNLGTVNETIGGLTGSGTVDFGSSNLTVEIPTGDSVSFGGNFTRLSGSHFYKTGDGTQVLTSNIPSVSGAFTYINAGTLSLGNGGSSGYLNGAISIDPNGNLTVNRSDTLTINAGRLYGSGQLTKRDADGTLYLSGTSNFEGDIIVDQGSLRLLDIAAINTASDFILNAGGALHLDRQNVILGSLSGTGAVIQSDNTNPYIGTYETRGNLSVGWNNNDTTFSGSIYSLRRTDSDTPDKEISDVSGGAFTKGGFGTLEFGPNIYNVTDTLVRGGTLKLAAGNTLANDQNVILYPGAFLDITVDGETFGGLSGTGGTVRMGARDLKVGSDNIARTYQGGLSNYSGEQDGVLVDDVLTNDIQTGLITGASAGDFYKQGVNLFSIAGALDENLAHFHGDFVIEGGGLALSPSTGVTYAFSGSRLKGSGNLRQWGEGTLSIVGDPTDFNGNFVVDSISTLDFNLGSGLTVAIASDRFTGEGTLQKSGDGTLTMDGGDGGFTGDILVAEGTFKSGGSGNSLSDSTSVDLTSGAIFLLTGDEQFGGITGAGGTFDLAGFEGNIGNDNATAAVFSGSIVSLGDSGGNLLKRGTGKLTLSGSTSYTGGTEIRSGTLALGASDILPGTGGFHVNGGTFDLDTFSDSVGPVTLSSGSIIGTGTLTSSSYTVESGTISAKLGGSGALTKSTSGTVTLTGNNSGFSGGVTVAGGTLALDTASGVSDTFSNAITGSGNLQKTGTGSLTLSGLTTAGFTGNYAIATGTLAIDTSNANLAITHDDLSGASGTTLEKTGTGTLTLSGDWEEGDDFESAVSVSSGTLKLGAGDVLGNAAIVTLSSGTTLDLSSEGENFGNLSGGGSVTLGSENMGLGYNNMSSVYSGNISGNGGSLTKTGSALLTLSGTNSYSGGTTINGGTLRLSGGNALADTGAVALTNTAGVSLDLNNSLETIGSLSGGGSTGGNVTLGSGTLTVGSGTFNGEIGIASDSGGLTKVGPGTLTLNGTSRYQGTTTVDGGTLTLGHAENTLRANSAISINHGATLAIGSNSDTVGPITLNSGAITGSSGTLTASSYTVKSGTISAKLGTGTLTKTTSGTVTLSGDNALTAVNINDGTLALGTGNIVSETAVITLTGGSLDSSAEGEQIGNLAGTGGTVNLGTERLTVGLNNLPSSFTGALSGPGELRKSGTSTFTLGTAGITGFTGSIDLATGGFALNSVPSSTDLVGSTITGAGALTKTGSGTLVLTGNNTYQGGTILAAGTLKVGSTGAINASGTLSFTGGTLQYGSANQTDYSGRFSTDNNQAYAIDTNGQTVTFSTDLQGNHNTLTKSGAGILILASKNSYDGGTTINGGILRLGRDIDTLSDTGAITVDGGTLDLATHSDTVGIVHLNSGNITGSGTLTSNSAFNVKSGTISANLAGSASLTKTSSGVVTLAGTNNSYSGDTQVNEGVLRLGAAGALSPNTTLNVAPGAKFEANGHAASFAQLNGTGDIDVGTGGLSVAPSSGTNTFHGRLIGAGGLIKNGAGVLELSGTNTFTGQTTINAGRIKLTGSAADSAFRINDGGTLSGAGTLGPLTIADGGTLAPGNSPGTLNAGHTTWESGGAFEFEINNAAGIVSTNWDLLNITGDLTISATDANPFSLNLVSLTAANTAGIVPNFDANTDASWTFVTTSTGITFAEGASVGASFTLNTAGFQNTVNGTFGLTLANAGNDLALTYTTSAVPEPSTTAALLGLIGLALAATHRRRRAGGL